MTRKSDLLRNQDRPGVFGHELDPESLTPIRHILPPVAYNQDTGCDPLGDGTFRMHPSGDIVGWEERNIRLAKS